MSRENGAEAEVESLRSAFDDTGFTVFKDKWTHVDQLQEYVGHLLSMPVIHEACTFLFACVMSHGKLGQLCGSESSSVPINTLIRLLKRNMPLQIPLVRSIQFSSEPAWQNAQYSLTFLSQIHRTPDNSQLGFKHLHHFITNYHITDLASHLELNWIFWEAVSRLNFVAPPSLISVAHHLVNNSFKICACDHS